MAQAMLAQSKLRLVYQIGIDDKGMPIVRAKTLNNIKKEATANQLYQVAQALSVLCNDTLSNIERADNTEILA